jgi:hypothetical protein
MFPLLQQGHWIEADSTGEGTPSCIGMLGLASPIIKESGTHRYKHKNRTGKKKQKRRRER